MAELTGAHWRKSTRSDNGGSTCVEVARDLPGVVGIRDSKDSSGPALAVVTPDTWRSFLADVKHNAHDLS